MIDEKKPNTNNTNNNTKVNHVWKRGKLVVKHSSIVETTKNTIHRQSISIVVYFILKLMLFHSVESLSKRNPGEVFFKRETT